MTKGTDHFDDEWAIHDGTKWVFVGIDFRIARKNGFFFTLFKLCDGPWDVLFPDEIVENAREQGQPMLPYVWLYSSNWHSMRKQADKWYPILKNYKAIVIDFEDFLGEDFPTGSDLWGVITILREKGYQGKIIVYTRKGYWLEFASADPAWLEEIDYLWLADLYGELEVPAPFTKEHVIMRQISWTLDPALAGISERVILSGCDENVWLGSMELFEELFGVKLPADDEPIEEPPTNGGTMITRKGTVVAKGLHVRKGPGTEYDDALPGLVEKDQVEADRIENGYWWHLTKIKGVAVTVEAWSSAGETGGYIRTDEVIEPPSGGEPVTVEMLANGAVVHSSQVQPGGKVTITVTDA